MKKSAFITFIIGYIIAFFFMPCTIFGQSAQENLEKYWNYRDRFKKYFVKLGADEGESILVNERCTNQSPHPFGLSCGCATGNDDNANVVWGDATIWTGYYLAVLATEYALLNQNGQDTKNTLNEIYYTLNEIFQNKKRFDS